MYWNIRLLFLLKLKPTRAPPVSTAAEFVDIPTTNIRRVIADRLTLSKQSIPHYYLTVECGVDQLLKIRQQLNEDLANSDSKISINDFVTKAAALACKKVPEANSEWRGEVIRKYNSVHINVAVSTPQGLFTPLLKNVDQLGLAAIAAKTKELAVKAKDGKISLEDIQPGTFTISNLGMFGIKQFTAVINPPQACILAVGTTDKRLVFDDKAKETQNPVKVQQILTVTLSCDHRVVDGAVGAQWLKVFKEFMENPLKMLL